MAVNCIRSKCGHQEIKGRPYFLPYFRPGQPSKNEPHCFDCAKEIIGPQIEANLKDTRTLLRSFGEFFPDGLSEVGRIEVVDGKTKVRGRLGGAIVAFHRGDLFPAKAASSTTLAEAHYWIGKYLLEAIARLFPYARYRDRYKVTSELAYTRERLVECEAQRQVVEDHRKRQEIIPTDNRRAFLEAASDIFIRAKKVLDVIGGSFHSAEKAAHVSVEDGRLIEVVKGFNPTALVTKPEDEVGEAEKPPEMPAEVPPASESETVAEAPTENQGKTASEVGTGDSVEKPPPPTKVAEVPVAPPAVEPESKPTGKRRSSKPTREAGGRKSVRLGSAEADDPITISRALNARRRRQDERAAATEARRAMKAVL